MIMFEDLARSNWQMKNPCINWPDNYISIFFKTDRPQIWRPKKNSVRKEQNRNPCLGGRAATKTQDIGSKSHMPTKKKKRKCKFYIHTIFI